MKWIYGHPRLYDFVDSFFSGFRSEQARKKALAGLSADSFLEVGAGTGKSFRHVKSGLMIGLDASVTMLESARRKAPEVIAVAGDAHRLPFRDGSLDVSLFSYCLRGLARPLDAVTEALRVSSRVIILDYSRPSLMPEFIWNRVVNRLGYAVFGSRDIDFESLERLAARGQVSELYDGLYRLMVLEGVGNAGS
jgi:ubiquinone/menaquinone biosynthesis C-methylase UbiE